MTEQEMQMKLALQLEKLIALRQEVADMNIECKYWRQVHIQAAIAAMQAELSNPNNTFMACEDKKAIITRRSVRYAEALVAELKKGGQDD